MTVKKMIDFSLKSYNINAKSFELPLHDREALENYFIYGYAPGGFLTSMLANDVHRAAGNADQTNKEMMWVVAYWIVTCAPHGSWGSYKQVDDWCNDKGGRRTAYAHPILKQYTMDVLSH